MRDPLENKELPSMLMYAGGIEPPGLSLPEAQQLVGEIRGQMRVLSLTMDATGYEDEQVRAFGRGYARPPMWEHYAEAHTGVCLVFSANCMTGPGTHGGRRGAGTGCGAERTDGGAGTAAGPGATCRTWPAAEAGTDRT
jgi:hypothetical protein